MMSKNGLNRLENLPLVKNRWKSCKIWHFSPYFSPYIVDDFGGYDEGEEDDDDDDDDEQDDVQASMYF